MALRLPSGPPSRVAAHPVGWLVVLAALAGPAALPTRPATPASAATAAAAPEEFHWAQGDADLGPVRLPVPGREWRFGPTGLDWRRTVPSWSGDPTFQLVLPPPQSGHAEQVERALVQRPADWDERPGRERVVCLAFHAFGTSEKDVFLNSDLPAGCRARGWMLVAPYGLHDAHLANPGAQAAVDAVLAALGDDVNAPGTRVVTAGFSMGGLTALSYAMRHRDPRGPCVSAVAVHSAPLDVARLYAEGRATVRRLCEHVFGAAPDVAPFEYARVSPARLGPRGWVDPEAAPVVNLERMPVLLHANLADPNAELVAALFELERFLSARGALVREHLVFEPEAGHHWATLDVERALDFLAAAPLAVPPRSGELFADRPARYGALDVRDLPRGRHARLRFELEPYGPGSLALRDTRDLNALAIDARLAGLDPSRPVTLLWSSADGAPLEVVLTGVLALPSRVLVDGALAPPKSWSWNETARELRLRLLPGDAPVRVKVEP